MDPMLRNFGKPWTLKLQALKARALGKLSIAVQYLMVLNRSQALGLNKSSAFLVVTSTNSRAAGAAVVIFNTMKEIPTVPW
jgi:hypothetical protein